MAFEPICPGGCHDSDWMDFDHYCDSANIQSGEEPSAFAAWLHALHGWDGEVERVN
jgi:hypothetical protein